MGVVWGCALLSILWQSADLYAVDGNSWNAGAGGWAMDYDLSGVNASYIGEAASDYSGNSVASVGDLNGDGLGDIVIGAPWYSGGGYNYGGQTYVIFGQSSGWAMDTNLSNASASYLGNSANGYAGNAVAGAGDVNGDGKKDFLIGAYGANKAYLILGKSSGWAMDTSLTNSDANFSGESSGDQAGIAVAGIGDINNDGFDDIAIGAHYDDDAGNNAGQVYIILGKASGWANNTNLSAADASYWGEAASDMAGSSVSGAGDVNNDGFADFLIGAYGNDAGGAGAGQVYLILGKASGWAMDVGLANADASFIGEAASDTVGIGLDGAGDVNGDGFDDIIIGAYGNDGAGSGAGQAYLIFGKASGWAMDTNLSGVNASYVGESASDFAGLSVAGIGDVNRDGFDDVAVGAPGDDDAGNVAGQVYIIFGKASNWAMDTSLSSASASFWGESAVDQISYTTYNYSQGAIDGGGDFDGNTYPDIIIGSYNNAEGGATAGQTYIILAPTLNYAPSASAGSNLTDQLHANTITLSGTCTDTDSASIEGWWSQTAGTSCTLSGHISTAKAQGASPLTVAAGCAPTSISANETLTFQLSCDDGVAATVGGTKTVGVNAMPTASPQILTGDEDSSKAFTLSGSDPNSESLTYTLVSGPSHGTLSGTLPNVTYTPDANYNGSDSFTFKVNDGLQDSGTVTITLNVSSSNDAPVISENSSDLIKRYTYGYDYNLPQWTASDVDSVSLTTQWRYISGPQTLYFTQDNKVDTTNYHPIRGTYYAQMTTSDGTMETTSNLVELHIPNNPPIIGEDDIEIADASFQNNKFVLTGFKGALDIASSFSDYDNDNLNYSWRLVGNSGNASGFSSVNRGAASLALRKAGTTTVEVAADDGFGGITTYQIPIYQPPPEVTGEDLNILVTTQTLIDDDTQIIAGQLRSPVWPIVKVNDVEASVELAETPSADVSGVKLFSKAQEDTASFDTYTFTALSVPVGSDTSLLNIEVLTDVDGNSVLLASQSLSLGGGGSGGDGGSEGSEEEALSLGIESNWGCTLTRLSYPNHYLTIISTLLFLALPLAVAFVSRGRSSPRLDVFTSNPPPKDFTR